MKKYKNNKIKSQVSKSQNRKHWHALQPFTLYPRPPAGMHPRDFYKRFIGKGRGGRLYPLVLFICNQEDQIIDAKIVKTKQRLDIIVDGYIGKGLKVMVHPQPVQIPKNFWYEWKTCRDGYARVNLVKEKGLVTDENIYAFTSLVLDIDSPYYEVEPKFLELMKILGVSGYECGKTKRGRFRAFIYLDPTTIKKEESEYTFYLTPKSKHKNKHTHLTNYKEMLAILNAYFQKKNLDADPSFVRANHPVWIGRSFYTMVKRKEGAIRFYDLYNAVKNLQKQYELWETNRIYWPEYYEYHRKKKERELRKAQKEKQKNNIYMLPDTARIIAKQYDNFTKWKLAVKKLADLHTSYRFTRVMMPACGWAKDLGLNESDVYDYLLELLPDKKNFKVDFQKAWKYGNCRFEWSYTPTSVSTDINPESLLEAFLKFVIEPRKRQDIVQEICNGIEAIYYSVEKYALEQGFIAKEKDQTVKGRGRKPFIVSITEKGRAYLEALHAPKDKQRKEALRDTTSQKNTLSPEKLIFSIYKNPPIGGAIPSLKDSSDLEEQGLLKETELTQEKQRYGLVVDGHKKLLFKGCLKINRYIPTDSKLFKNKYSSFCLKIICLFKDIDGYGNPGKSFSDGNLYEKLMLYAFENKQEALKWLEDNVRDVDEIKLRIKTSIKFNDVCTFRRTEEDGWRFVSIDLSMRKENQDPSLISELPSTSCETKRKHPFQIITDKLHPIKFWKDKKEYRRLDKPA